MKCRACFSLFYPQCREFVGEEEEKMRISGMLAVLMVGMFGSAWGFDAVVDFRALKEAAGAMASPQTFALASASEDASRLKADKAKDLEALALALVSDAKGDCPTIIVFGDMKEVACLRTSAHGGPGKWGFFFTSKKALRGTNFEGLRVQYDKILVYKPLRGRAKTPEELQASGAVVSEGELSQARLDALKRYEETK